jgi:arylsulfatase A-like enzyme
MKIASWLLLLVICCPFILKAQDNRPNVLLIYVDDLGYGDLGSYGATKIKTQHLDKLAAAGLRFTNAHSSSATCTPSRYALMTGNYPWRVKGTGVLPGDAALIIPTNQPTIASQFKAAGYATGIVGKWHLGLGEAVAKNWNQPIKPGPQEVGFDYSFIFPATADRVPTVFLENQTVLAGSAADPIQVDYQNKVGTEPTGKEHPELLKMPSSPGHGHENTIVNGIGRIGYMSGGKAARWTDEEMPLTFLEKAKAFITQHQREPFFLTYALTEPHVPRMPSTMFKGKSGLGYRGDAILQLDWSVGEILKELEYLGLSKNTIVIFSSDNGPVLDDGYEDGAVTQLDGHKPAGILRGGKYSIFEAGTRVPMIIRWPGKVQPGVSEALVCQIDFLASFSSLLKKELPKTKAIDSENMLEAFLGKSKTGRQVLIEHAGSLSIVEGNWKYIEPSERSAYDPKTDTELGNAKDPQLYDLSKDPSERNNLASQYPDKVKALAEKLLQIKNK